jgi:hypothetical protein
MSEEGVAEEEYDGEGIEGNLEDELGGLEEINGDGDDEGLDEIVEVDDYSSESNDETTAERT